MSRAMITGFRRTPLSVKLLIVLGFSLIIITSPPLPEKFEPVTILHCAPSHLIALTSALVTPKLIVYMNELPRELNVGHYSFMLLLKFLLTSSVVTLGLNFLFNVTSIQSCFWTAWFFVLSLATSILTLGELYTLHKVFVKVKVIN